MKRFNAIKLMISLLIITSVLIPLKANAEWKSSNGQWYYTENGDYIKGWKNINGNWYYFSYPDGTIIHGGIDDVNGKLYYFDNDGVMKTGWIYVEQNGSNYSGWHYFYDDGSMAKNTTIDGYYLNSYGTWVSAQSIKDQIIGTWNVSFANGTNANVVITNNMIGNSSYTVVKEQTDNVIIDVNESYGLTRYMVKVSGNNIIFYIHQDSGGYTEIGEGTKN
jgi:hypothetical protein